MARTWETLLFEIGGDVIDTSPARPAFKFASVQKGTPQPGPQINKSPTENIAMSERMEKHAKLVQNREKWEANKASFYAWLKQTSEDALEPDLEIVDPHHHLWDMRSLGGFNLFGIFRQQLYVIDDLLDDVVGGGHNVTHTVYAEAHAFHSADADPLMAPLGEVQFVQGIAAQSASGAYGQIRAAAGMVHLLARALPRVANPGPTRSDPKPMWTES